MKRIDPDGLKNNGFLKTYFNVIIGELRIPRAASVEVWEIQ